MTQPTPTYDPPALLTTPTAPTAQNITIHLSIDDEGKITLSGHDERRFFSLNLDGIFDNENNLEGQLQITDSRNAAPPQRYRINLETLSPEA